MEGRSVPGFAGAAMLCLAILAVPAAADFGDGEFVVWTIDYNSNTGQYTSIGFDDDGYPWISYYSDGDLKIAWQGAGFSGWWTRTIDNIGDTGRDTSLAFSGSGNPCISYHKYTDNDLKYAYSSGSSWYIDEVDTDYAGYYTSLAFDGSGNPWISHHDSYNGDLKVSRKWGGAWITETAASSGTVGSHSSIAFDGSGIAWISYYDSSNGNLMCAKKDGTWSREIVDSAGDVGYYTSLRFSPAGVPWITYYDNTNGNLKYAYHTSTGWISGIIDSTGNVGWSTSLAFDSDGNPCVSYYDRGLTNLKFAYRSGGSWHQRTVDSAGDVGHYSSLAFDADGRPCISYYDFTNGHLKYAYLPAPPVVTSITPDTGRWGDVLPVTVTGSGFSGTPQVRLTSISEVILASHVTRISESELTCTFTIPASADLGAHHVAVTNPDGQTGRLDDGFTIVIGVVTAPTVTSITPAASRRGRTVEITDLSGTGFQAGATVTLLRGANRIQGRGVTVESATRITCRFRIPADARTGLWDVRVRNPGGLSGTLPDAFRIRA